MSLDAAVHLLSDPVKALRSSGRAGLALPCAPDVRGLMAGGEDGEECRRTGNKGPF